jgi:hypothetical protein
VEIENCKLMKIPFLKFDEFVKTQKERQRHAELGSASDKMTDSRDPEIGRS